MLKRVIKSTIDTICEKEKHIKSMKPADSFIVVVVVVIYIYIYISLLLLSFIFFLLG